MNLTTAHEFATYILAWCVFAPFVGAGLVAIYYELRYQAGIRWQRYLDKGLFK